MPNWDLRGSSANNFNLIAPRNFYFYLIVKSMKPKFKHNALITKVASGAN